MECDNSAVTEIGDAAAIRNPSDQGIQWSWGDLNPRPPRCERCGQIAVTWGNKSTMRACGAAVERAT